MEVLLCWLVGILFATSVYLLLNKNLVRVLFGIMLIGTAINLLIFAAGRLTEAAPAFVHIVDGKTLHRVANALPQALILTAIVIGFGVVSFSLVLITKAWQELGSVDADRLDQAKKRYHSKEIDL